MGCGCFLSYCLCFYFSPLYFVSCSWLGRCCPIYRYRKVRVRCVLSSRTRFKAKNHSSLALVGQASGLKSPGPRVQLTLAGTETGQLETKLASFSRQSHSPCVFLSELFSLQSAQNDHHPHLTPVLELPSSHRPRLPLLECEVLFLLMRIKCQGRPHSIHCTCSMGFLPLAFSELKSGTCK